MSTEHSILLTHEYLDELLTILESHHKATLVELRRSTPNSEFKHYLRHRAEIIQSLIDVVQKARTEESAASAA